MTFSISIAMTMHFGSGISRYARKCQKSLTSFERRQVVLVIWLMPSEDYKLIKLLFSLKWKCIVPLPYFFRSIPAWFKVTRRLMRNVFRARGLVKLWVAPPSPSNGSAQFQKTKVPSNPSLVKKSGVLDRRVKLRGFIHITCSCIYDTC